MVVIFYTPRFGMVFSNEILQTSVILLHDGNRFVFFYGSTFNWKRWYRKFIITWYIRGICWFLSPFGTIMNTCSGLRYLKKYSFIGSIYVAWGLPCTRAICLHGRTCCLHAKPKTSCMPSIGAIAILPGGSLHVAGSSTFANNTALDDGGEWSYRRCDEPSFTIMRYVL